MEKDLAYFLFLEIVPDVFLLFLLSFKLETVLSITPTILPDFIAQDLILN